MTIYSLYIFDRYSFHTQKHARADQKQTLRLRLLSRLAPHKIPQTRRRRWHPQRRLSRRRTTARRHIHHQHLGREQPSQHPLFHHRICRRYRPRCLCPSTNTTRCPQIQHPPVRRRSKTRVRCHVVVAQHDQETVHEVRDIANSPSVLRGLTRFARDEQFTSYCTSTYRLHLYETLSGYKFVCLSDPATDGLRFVLRQIYSGPFVNFVVRNPLVPMDSREQGIDNDYFRASVDRLIRGLSAFA